MAVRVRTAAVVGTLLLVGATGCDGTGATMGSAGPEAKAGTALAAVDGLAVKGRAPKTGFARDKFGSPWVDTESNGCDTRIISMLRAVTGLFSQRMQGAVGSAY